MLSGRYWCGGKTKQNKSITNKIPTSEGGTERKARGVTWSVRVSVLSPSFSPVLRSRRRESPLSCCERVPGSYLVNSDQSDRPREALPAGSSSCVLVLAGAGVVLHGGQQVGHFGSLGRSDVLGHVHDTVHGHLRIPLHQAEKTQFNLSVDFWTNNDTFLLEKAPQGQLKAWWQGIIY